MKKDRTYLGNSLYEIKWIFGLIRGFIGQLSGIVVLGAVATLLGVFTAVILKNLIDAAMAGDKHLIVMSGVTAVITILLQIALEAIRTALTSRTFEGVAGSIREKAFSHVLYSQWADTEEYHTGDLMMRMTRDVGILANVLVNIIPDIFSLGVGLVASFITLFFYDPIFAVLAFLIGPAALLLSRLLGGRLRGLQDKIQETEGAYRSYMQESISNLMIVKAFSLEVRNTQHINRLQRGMVSIATRRSYLIAGANSVLSLGYWGGYFLAFYWGAMGIARGTGTFGTMTIFLQLVGQVNGPLIELAHTYPRLVAAWSSAGRLMELENMKSEGTAEAAPTMEGAGLIFENVDFSYGDGESLIRNASCEICPGEIAALIGPSGEGKTTFIRLILALVRPNAGKIYITESKSGEKFEVTPASRSLVAYVPQGNTLFSGTIRENIILGRPDATEMEIREASGIANALEFIEKLPEGLDTYIGEEGFGLSEGQAQRIAIARGILKPSPILILDEATSALDVDTERKVLQGLKGLAPLRTCIIITHRTGAFEICDKILKLKDGYINE